MYKRNLDNELKLYIIWTILAIIYVIFLMPKKAESLVYIQQITDKMGKADIMAINSNFRNLNQMKQDSNFIVFTSTPTTTNFTHEGIVLGNLTGSGNKRLFININGTIYHIVLTAN